MTKLPAEPSKPSTIYDVARAAGVSHQTVAMYLKGHRGFRPETRQRVQDALKELNYRPNLAARSLATAKSHRIGALVYELLEVGPSKTIAGASSRAREFGFLLDIVNLNASDDQAVHRALAALGQQDLAGVLAFAPIDQISQEIQSTPFDVPFIAETEVHDSDDPGSLNGVGMRLLADHLLDQGHRRFFSLSGPTDWLASRRREAAFVSAIEGRGELLGSVAGNWSAMSGYAAASTMPLDRNATAVVVANDQMALGAQLALAERGIDVPRDMSVTGFDDIPEAAFFRPPLTTVRVDYGRQGGILLDRLLAVIGVANPAPMRPVPPQLIVRASTGPAAR